MAAVETGEIGAQRGRVGTGGSSATSGTAASDDTEGPQRHLSKITDMSNQTPRSVASNRSFPKTRFEGPQIAKDELWKGGTSSWKGFTSQASGRKRHSVGPYTVFIEDGEAFGQCRSWALGVLSGQLFDACIGLVIVVNCVTIGLELSYPQMKEFIDIMEHVFLVIYLMELIFRFFALRSICIDDNAIKFDCVLVVSGVVSQWIMSPLAQGSGVDVANPDEDPAGNGDQMRLVMVLRVTRLLRLARTIKMLMRFKDLWILVRGLLDCGSILFYTMVLLFIMLYIFACAGLELVGRNWFATANAEDSEEFKEIVLLYFPDLPTTMLTLLQFVCLDSIGSIYNPLVRKDWTLIIYFMAAILVIGIVLMNLITAVIVNNAMANAESDREVQRAEEEKRKKKLIRELRELFRRLDDDGSGEITYDELDNITEEDRRMLERSLTISDPYEIFAALDVDDSGHIDIDEFCDGIWQVAMTTAPIEIKRIEKQVNRVRQLVNEQADFNAKLMQTQTLILESISELHGKLAIVPWATSEDASPKCRSSKGSISEAAFQTCIPASAGATLDEMCDHLKGAPGVALVQPGAEETLQEIKILSGQLAAQLHGLSKSVSCAATRIGASPQRSPRGSPRVDEAKWTPPPLSPRRVSVPTRNLLGQPVAGTWANGSAQPFLDPQSTAWLPLEAPDAVPSGVAHFP